MMAIKYRVKTKPDNINKRAAPRYYAVPVRTGEIDLRWIAKRLSERSSLTSGDIFATIIGLVEILETSLHDGYSVRIDGLGIFTLSVSSDGYDHPNDCMPHRVEARKICFRADPRLKKQLKHVKFVRDKELRVMQ
jgi:predicted histone-like DNA-binding protein